MPVTFAFFSHIIGTPDSGVTLFGTLKNEGHQETPHRRATVYILGQAIHKLQSGLISIEFEQISTDEYLFPSFSFCLYPNVGQLIYDYNYTEISVRGHPFMTSAKFSDFLTPSPLVRSGQLVYTIKSRNLPYFVRFSTTPSPSARTS